MRGATHRDWGLRLGPRKRGRYLAVDDEVELKENLVAPEEGGKRARTAAAGGGPEAGVGQPGCCAPTAERGRQKGEGK